MHKYDKIDDINDIPELETPYAYSCVSQDSEGLEEIREHLDNDYIDATMFQTHTGDYTDIYVSFYEGLLSYSVAKTWYKVRYVEDKKSVMKYAVMTGPVGGYMSNNVTYHDTLEEAKRYLLDARFRYQDQDNEVWEVIAPLRGIKKSLLIPHPLVYAVSKNGNEVITIGLHERITHTRRLL